MVVADRNFSSASALELNGAKNVRALFGWISRKQSRCALCSAFENASEADGVVNNAIPNASYGRSVEDVL